jgi:ADP-ribosylglycohydrolase
MRCAIIGVHFADYPDRRRAFVDASTLITHTDERTRIAAQAIAKIAAAIVRHDPLLNGDFTALLRPLSADLRWTALLDEMRAAFVTRKTVAEFAAMLNLDNGVTGYAWHTAPMALYAWARHRGDFRAALTAILDCGGDTDTTGAIVGALAGAELGEAAIPAEWLDGIVEWPRSVAWMRRTALALAGCEPGSTATPPPYFWPGLLPRNLALLAIALTHGFARLLPR